METIVLPALLIAIIYKANDVIKYITNGQWKDVATQVVVYVVALGATFAAAGAQAFNDYIVPGMTEALGQLDSWSKVLVAFALGSAASAGFDAKKAVDRNDSAKTPPMFPPSDSLDKAA